MRNGLIDRGALLKTLEKYVNPMPNNDGGGFLSGLSTAMDAIEAAPTVPAVEVVRCQDCKHCMAEKLLCLHPKNRVFNTGISVRLEHFCSYGERKEG